MEIHLGLDSERIFFHGVLCLLLLFAKNCQLMGILYHTEVFTSLSASEMPHSAKDGTHKIHQLLKSG